MLKQQDFIEKTDEELVGLSLTNQVYFVCLINRYQDKLMRYVRRISNFSYEDAEDILQEVFIKVYQNLNYFNPKLKFSSWIYRITHNEVISSFRKKHIRPQPMSWEINDDLLENITADFDVKKEIDQQYLQHNIKQILSKLEDKYAQILELKYLEDKSYQEISDILQKSPGTIASLLHRAKKRFFHQLKAQKIKL
jgi:RNA polymerase sigma-70 factor, ECF subfamily